MKSRATPDYWHEFHMLPDEVQRRARSAYRLWRSNPRHPSLHFKRVSRRQPIYSVRVGLEHRALGLLEGDTVTWYWIGAHDEYERLLS